MTDKTDRAAAPLVPRPRSIDLAIGAILANGVLTIASAGSLYLVQPELRTLFVKLNRTAKSPKANYDAAAVNSDLHSFLSSSMLQGLFFGIAIAALTLPIRAGKNWSRWVTIVVVGFLSFTRLTSLGADLPGLFKVANILAALTGLTGIGMLLVRTSVKFFAARNPRMRAAGSAPQSGLRGLFAPRPVAPRARPGVPTSSSSGAGNGGGKAAGRPVKADRPAKAAGRPVPADRPVKVKPAAGSPVKADLTKRPATGSTAFAPAGSNRSRPPAKGRGGSGSAKSRRS